MNLWHEMKSRWDKTLASQPRWDGNRLAFTINTEGNRIPCAISRPALQNLSRHTHLATSDLLVMDSRDKIEEIAARIFHITPDGYPARSAYAPTTSTIRRRLVHLPPVRSFHSPSMVRPQQVREHSRHPDLIRRCVVEAGTSAWPKVTQRVTGPCQSRPLSRSASGEYALPEDDAGEAAISQQRYHSKCPL